MDNNNNLSFADLWPSAWLLRAATVILRPSEHYCKPDVAQKAVPAKVRLFIFGSASVLVIVTYVAY